MEETSSKGGVKKDGTASPFDRIPMPEVKGWLNLKVSDQAKPGNHSRKASLLISIPKKIVKLATRRNRLKRLVREAFRKEVAIDLDKIYQFRVVQEPNDPGFDETKDTVRHLIQTLA